jgi:hypothetical protein
MYLIGALSVNSISLIASKLVVTISKACYGSKLLNNLLRFNITLKLNANRNQVTF